MLLPGDGVARTSLASRETLDRHREPCRARATIPSCPPTQPCSTATRQRSDNAQTSAARRAHVTAGRLDSGLS